MKRFTCGFLFILLLCTSANAAILVMSPNGVVTTKSSLSDAASAADAAGKTVVVTSALSAALSNISSGSLHSWPSDRKLVVEKGGSISNTTVFNISGEFQAGLSQVFTGTGKVVFNAGSTNEIRPEWWGVNGTNDEVPIQAAINAAVNAHIPVKLSVHDYGVSSTITLYDGTYLVGEKGDQYPNGYGKDPKSTKITFTPSSPLVLFQYAPYTGNATGQNFHTSVSGIYMHGDGTANSTVGISVKDVIYGRFTNLAIVGFKTAISNEHTILNRFEFVFASGTVSAIEYKGLTSTTDIWDSCTFFGSPVGVATAGPTVGIRFVNCNFEQLDTYGADIVKETENMIFENCYSEDVPYTKVSSNAMFKVGYSGTKLASANNISILGGYYKGYSATTTGSFFDSDYCNNASITGVTVNKYTNLFNATSNTRNNSVVVYGLQAGAITKILSGSIDKIAGVFPVGVMSATTQGQVGYFNHIISPTIKGNTSGTGVVTIPAALITLANTSGAVIPGADNSVALGASNARWSVVYAGTGTINTSDERYKKDIRPINPAVLRAWGKVDLVQYRFKDNPEKIHFGVVAQRIIEAFASEGLNAMDYGLVNYENDIYGVRYEECLALETAYLRSKLAGFK